MVEIRILELRLSKEAIYKQIQSAKTGEWNGGVEKLVIQFGEERFEFKTSYIKEKGDEGCCVIEYVDDTEEKEESCSWGSEGLDTGGNKKDLSKELTKAGFEFLNEISDGSVCDNRTCLGCRIADILFEIENKYQNI